ncbi:CoA ester lyase [Nocardioides sp. AN3]
MTADPTVATTWLFVPASRPDRFDKALANGADVVIIDLEDAVAPADKAAARAAAATYLATGAQVAVRINPPGTPWHDRDLDLVATHRPTVILPKAEEAAAVAAISERARAAMIPLIESALGTLNAPAIARTSGVCRLALGNVDLAAQLGVNPADRTALQWSRSMLVTASVAAGIAAPIDGVTLDVTDSDAAADDARHGHRLGFGAKLCIHPAQVAAVRTAFAPSEADVAWAQRIIEAAGAIDGVAVVDGAMVDRPVVLRAQSILASTLD